MWSSNPKNFATAFFRKHFTLTEAAIGYIRAVLDDEGDIYINGTLALKDTIANGTDITAGNITQYLRVGENVMLCGYLIVVEVVKQCNLNWK